MQQLGERNTYIPTDTSLVCSSMTCELNKDQSPSATGLKTSSNYNNPEETQSQHKGKQNSRVFVNVCVLNIRGEPLMPTSPRNAKKFLKEEKAKVVKRCPFTIQMLIPTGETKQTITLGIDSGYDKIGYSCLTKRKVLIHGELKLDQMMKKRLEERKMYRKLRRKKLWYRKPRFLNRKISKGWLPPSIQRKFDTHIALIERLKKILPITRIIIEVGQFNIQKIDNPDIQEKEYKYGNLYDYINTKDFVFAREKGTCQLCKKKNGKFQLHHIIPRSQGGTDKSDNLALLHEGCHKKLHKKHLENSLDKNKQYKANTFMNIIQKRFKDLNYDLIYGYITSVNRNNLNLEKSHANDAFVIAGGTTQEFPRQHNILQKRKNNRSLQTNIKGKKPQIRRKHYINQPHDLIVFEGEICRVTATCSYGASIKAITSSGEKVNAGIKKVKELYHTNGFVWFLI